MSESDFPGEEQEEQRVQFQKEPRLQSSKMVQGLAAGVIVLACATAASLVYGVRRAHDADQMAASQAQMTKQLEQTRKLLAALTEQMDALQSERAAQAVLARTAKPAPVRAARINRPQSAPRAAVERTSPEDSRLQRMREQIVANRESIDKTRTDLETELSSTRTDLNGSIAKNHDELVALEKRGEQNYYEFDLNKSKQFSREGPVSLAVRKTNTKHQSYDVDLLVNDSKLSKKHVNLYEPVMIYPEGSHRPIELVVNKVDKDRVHGYVSEPKYPETELVHNPAPQPSSAPSQGDESNAPAQTAKTAPQDRKRL